MSVLHKNARNVRFVLFRKNSNVMPFVGSLTNVVGAWREVMVYEQECELTGSKADLLLYPQWATKWKSLLLIFLLDLTILFKIIY